MYTNCSFFNDSAEIKKWFIIQIKYGDNPLESINNYLDQHRAFLLKNYIEGTFLVSGPFEPRTGGVIIAKNITRQELDAILEKDPFKQLNLASYKIKEFKAAMMTPALLDIQKKEENYLNNVHNNTFNLNK